MSHTEMVLNLPEATSYRRKLPDDLRGFNRKVEISGQDVYIRVGCFEDGTPAKIMVNMSKKGSPFSGIVSNFLESISMNLQAGYTLKELVEKFGDTRFEPSGFTTDPCITVTKSLVDYTFTLLAMKFMSLKEIDQLGVEVKCRNCDLAQNCARRNEMQCTV